MLGAQFNLNYSSSLKMKTITPKENRLEALFVKANFFCLAIVLL